ncbi:Hypothetical Protein MfeM64YM_0928 [Mycoplasmopsis fermentans M64]|uniref:Uncharacterized protein n=1 Tax=Mycoplasmopsis fermentans (strain M64) TaxID=943945 RepID=A0AB32XCS4_MYCFM|nr:Hypothetical Protein MfeM64YM_0590 [Mycoplasmopsis fermentans M64]ADV34923.1 Hypothetical Protein MfeM64YM_0928 [Mycoplasmopsis fermentans M64]
MKIEKRNLAKRIKEASKALKTNTLDNKIEHDKKGNK